MKVENIVELTKGRKKIILDDGSSFCLYKGELDKLNIKIDREIEPDKYKKIMEEILPKRAKLRGLNLLSKRPYTEGQLRRKYIEGGYPVSSIEEAITYLKDKKFIDDFEYCKSYFLYKSATKSKRMIVNDLKQKGVDEKTIERAYFDACESGDITDEKEVIERLLGKKHYIKDEAGYEEKQKIMNYLYNKGFSMDVIHRYV